MSRFPLAASVLLGSALVFASACKGGKHHASSVDPIEDGGDDGCGSDCPDAGEGPDGAQLEVELNNCPHVAIEVTPARAPLDQPIRVASRAQDADGDAMTYEWRAEPDGDYDDAAEAVTSYRCQSLGRKLLQLIATDAQGCDAMGEVEVSCVAGEPP